MKQPRRIIAALGSLTAIAVLLVGVPIALWLLAGSPIPDAAPSVAEIGAALARKGLPDSTIIAIFAVIGWIAWLHVAASIIVEAAAWTRGRPAPHLAFGGPIQPAIRKLVATAALLISTSTTPAFAAGTTTMARTPVVELVATPTINGAPHSLDGVSRSAATSATKSYVVVRYDTLWGLAEKHLGDPFRWHELFNLNEGRPQSDGRALTNADLIRPGWALQFPDDATGLSPTPVAPSDPRPTVATAPTNCAPATTTSTIPTRTTANAAVTSTPTSTTVRPAQATGPHPTEHDTGGNETTIPWPLVGGGLAAAGLVALLTKLQRVQQRRRPHSARPRVPEPAAEHIERAVRHTAETDVAERLDLALRAFAAGTTTSLSHPPNVLAVRTTPTHVELLLNAAPLHPPKGFVVTGDERGWITDPDLDIADLRTLAGDAAAPLPSLVNLGDLEGDHILIDLETIGLLTVDGPCATELINSVALQLATGTWIDHVDIIVASSDTTHDLTGADRVRCFADTRSALNELRAIASSFADALIAADATTTFDARFSAHHNDGWIPTVFISADAVDDETLDEVDAIVRTGGRGVAAIVTSTRRSGWHAEVTQDALRLAPLGFELRPTLLDTTTAALIDRALTDIAVGDQFETPNVDEPAMTPTSSGPYVDPEFDIEVRVLGPIEIAGIAARMDRRRSEELVVYLATHDGCANVERLKTVLWRDKAPTEGTWNTTVTFARTALGHDKNGESHLRHYSAADRVYRLGDRAITDLARFEARVAHANASDPGDAIVVLRSALELVRGAPFDHERGCEWAHSERIVADAEATIADAAHQLATLYLDAGDHAGATWAAMQGLKGCPGDESLYCDRMLACHLADDHIGVEAAFEELCEFVEALEPYDQLRPDTLALRARLRCLQSPFAN